MAAWRYRRIAITGTLIWVALTGSALKAQPGGTDRPPLALSQSVETPSDRIWRIARRLLIANADRCIQHRWEFGLLAFRPDKQSSVVEAKTQEKEPERFAIQRISPGGAADKAGLRVGDRLITANGVDWQSPEFTQIWNRAESFDPAVERITLQASRNKDMVTASINGERACAIPVFLLPKKAVNAMAVDGRIVVYSALEQALREDDELAAIMAHEVSHVLLGHVPAPAASNTNMPSAGRAFKPKRSQMEQDANALSVRLLLQAGIDPEAAVRAQAKLGKTGRGPISRLLGLWGPYMSAPKRQEFLREEADKARRERSQSAIEGH
ncbi:MAG: hypothetical protein EBS50_00560 [Sphingomonadaceae bacterium]|nr:hypothetical protein [Sphingomonadaceae bacterium]